MLEPRCPLRKDRVCFCGLRRAFLYRASVLLQTLHAFTVVLAWSASAKLHLGRSFEESWADWIHSDDYQLSSLPRAGLGDHSIPTTPRQQYLGWPHWPFTHSALVSPTSCPSLLWKALVSQRARILICVLSHRLGPSCWMRSREKRKAMIAPADFSRILPKKGRVNISTKKWVLQSHLRTVCVSNFTSKSKVQMITHSLCYTHCFVVSQICD